MAPDLAASDFEKTLKIQVDASEMRGLSSNRKGKGGELNILLASSHVSLTVTSEFTSYTDHQSLTFLSEAETFLVIVSSLDRHHITGHLMVDTLSHAETPC